MFRPVKTKKVYEEIIEQIKNLIVEKKLQPGDKLLSERELSEKLSASRASVREAFSALEMMGIISIRPGEGSFVRQVSFEGILEPLSFLLKVETNDIMQLLEVRKILEAETAALAANRALPENLLELEAALSTMVEEAKRGEVGDMADANFHFAVAKAANNAVLVKVMNTISDLMNTSFRAARQKIFLLENMPSMIYQSHCRIYEAIRDKNAPLARTRMRDHLALVEDAMLRIKNGEMKSLKDFQTDLSFPS